MFGGRLIWISTAFFLTLLFMSASYADAPSTMPAAYAVRDPSTLRMTLERDLCLSTCPYYKLEIAGDGTVTYEGLDCVAVKGTRTAHITDAEVKKLFTMFAAADFWSLKDQYRGSLPDAPGYYLSLAYDGKAKRVLDYEGTSAGMPKVVEDIEDAMDETANVKQWLWGTRDCSGRTITDQ